MSGDSAQWVVECLRSKHEALDSIPKHQKSPKHVCKPSSWDAEAGSDHSQLHGELEVSLGYLRPCLKINRQVEYRKFLEDLSSELAHCHSSHSFGQCEPYNQVQAESKDARPPTKRSWPNTVL